MLPAQPCTISIATSRSLRALAANAVPAGTMASSSGSATVAPRPFRTVRLERCFPVMYITLLINQLHSPHHVGRPFQGRRRLAPHTTLASLKESPYTSRLKGAPYISDVRNAALFTMPSTNADMRWSRFPAARTIARTVGMS